MDDDKKPQELRGLYSKVRISVSALNKIIFVLCALLVVCLIFAVTHGGYTVDFDTLGGTRVESEELRYGDPVTPPEPPTREGYIFRGWYTDIDTSTPWDMENDFVTESMTLYAGWDEAS